MTRNTTLLTYATHALRSSVFQVTFRGPTSLVLPCRLTYVFDLPIDTPMIPDCRAKQNSNPRRLQPILTFWYAPFFVSFPLPRSHYDETCPPPCSQLHLSPTAVPPLPAAVLSFSTIPQFWMAPTDGECLGHGISFLKKAPLSQHHLQIPEKRYLVILKPVNRFKHDFNCVVKVSLNSRRPNQDDSASGSSRWRGAKNRKR